MQRETGFCVVDRSWNEERARESKRNKCKQGDHPHIRYSQINTLWMQGYLEPLRAPGASIPDDEPDYIFRWLIPGVIQLQRFTPIRGLSCKVGSYHSESVRAKLPWAAAMLAQIQMRHEPRISKV